MSASAALDHVGVMGRDLADLAAAFESLGFCLTPLARHEGGRTANRAVMLRQGYIELLSVIDGGHSATLDRFLARYAGIHILSLAIDDPHAALARLHRAGLPDAAVSNTERATDDADPRSPRARFSLVTTPDMPEGRIHLIRHHTPEALWQDRFTHHPNHAVALEAAIIVSAHPAETAAALSLRSGRYLLPDPAGGYRLALSRGSVRILPPEALATVLPDAVAPTLPWIGGIALRTDDSTAALRRWLDERKVAYVAGPHGVSIIAGGATLLFT
jgi:hypothetical protein